MSKELRKVCEVCSSQNLISFNISKNPIKLEDLGSLEFKVTSKDYGRAIETVKCSDCKLIQPKYILTYAEIIRLYSNVEDPEYLNSSDSRGASNYNQVISIVRKYKQNAVKILEVGSGSGKMLSLLSKDFTVEGIEPNTNFCKFAKDTYGVTINNMGYEDFDKGGYDVIVALDVIEHVVSPKHFIEKIQKMLNKDGIAIIGTPDYASLSSSLLRSKWYHIRPPHIYYFSVSNMQLLVNKVDLSVLKIKTFSWALSFQYLFDAVQKLVFKKSFIKLPLDNVKLNINLRDSKIYILKKDR